MARRISAPYQSEPVSALAAWARRLAVFSLVATVVSILIVRFGFLEFRPAIATFFGALAFAGLSILVAFAAFAAIWQNGSRGMGRILAALLLDVAILAYPAYLAYNTRRAADSASPPPDQPAAKALAQVAPATATPPFAGPYSAELQHAAYPDIEPVSLDMPAQQAYDATLNLIKKRKWRIVDERPPQPPRREGRIEAVAYTPIMGFSEDIAVRVVADGDGSRVDLRSSSRYFEHDLGSNAARLPKLIDDINDADDDAAKPAKKQPTPASVRQAKGATRR